MKNIKYSALVAIAAIAASCAKESTVIEKETIKDIPMEPMCIQTGDESETKTSLDDLDGKTVNWTGGDQIVVFSNKDYSERYIFPATNIKGNTATFSGEVPAGTESFFAVYPPKRVSSASASGAVVNIPSDQTPAAGTFYEGLNITIAKGTKTPGTPNVGTIHFRNVCSYVKFTVPAYVSDVKSVKISSDNAIAGNLTVNYTEKDPSSTIAANGEKFISMSGSFGAGKTFIFVIAPGTVSNFKIDITTASGNWTRTVKAGFTAIAGKPVNLGTVDFKQVELTAEARHIDQDGTLVGTDLSVNLGLLKYVSNFNFVVKKGDTTVRSYSRESSEPVASSTVSFAWKDYADYPYLPQGEYTIEGSYTRPGGSTQAISGKFNVPAPTFSVKTHTSYDTYYNNGQYNNATAANKEDGSTIYNRVTISSDILSKYTSLIGESSYTINNKTVKFGENTKQERGEYNVDAKFTFDGVEASETRTCHVTGLPFIDNSIVTSNYSGWRTSNASINTGSIDINGARYVNGCGYIMTPKIVTPSSINVIVSLTAKSNQSLSSSTMKLYLGATSNNNSPSTTKEISFNKSSSTKSTNFSVDNAYISFRAGMIDGKKITISSLSIKYY